MIPLQNSPTIEIVSEVSQSFANSLVSSSKDHRMERYRLKRLDFPGSGALLFNRKYKSPSSSPRLTFASNFFVYCFIVHRHRARGITTSISGLSFVLVESYLRRVPFEKLPPDRIILIRSFHFIELCDPDSQLFTPSGHWTVTGEIQPCSSTNDLKIVRIVKRERD